MVVKLILPPRAQRNVRNLLECPLRIFATFAVERQDVSVNKQMNADFQKESAFVYLQLLRQEIEHELVELSRFFHIGIVGHAVHYDLLRAWYILGNVF